jgi:putative SOS response-associated peptidase YedK
MCGLIVRSTGGKAIGEYFRAIGSPNLDAPPRYNVAPTQDVLLVRSGPEGNQRVLVPMLWGLPRLIVGMRTCMRIRNNRAENGGDDETDRAGQEDA